MLPRRTRAIGSSSCHLPRRSFPGCRWCHKGPLASSRPGPFRLFRRFPGLRLHSILARSRCRQTYIARKRRLWLDKHHPDHELPDGASPRNTRNEHADERCPADPPAPIEDGPATLPADIARFIGCPEAHRNDVPKIVTQGCDEEAHQPFERSKGDEGGQKND